MKVIVAGHEYEVANPGGTKVVGALFFVHKEIKNGKLELVKDGTTTEEVLAVLIDRLEYLDTQLPCKENKVAIKALINALVALEKRTADRRERDVEGTTNE